MLLFVYTTTRKRFVTFTCRYFKLSWNTTALSQSNCRIFSCSGIISENSCTLPGANAQYVLWMYNSFRKLIFQFKANDLYRKYWWRLLRYVGKRCRRLWLKKYGFEGFRNVPVFIVPKVISRFLLFGFIGITRDTAQVVISLVMEKKEKSMKIICCPFLSVFVMRSFFFRIKNMILKKGLMKAVDRR